MEITGEVITGDRFEHKPPTANVVMQKRVPVGVYLGRAFLGTAPLGRAAVWVLPHQAHIAEVYVSEFEGDLYGSYLTVKKLKQLNRVQLIELYDKALSDD